MSADGDECTRRENLAVGRDQNREFAGVIPWRWPAGLEGHERGVQPWVLGEQCCLSAVPGGDTKL